MKSIVIIAASLVLGALLGAFADSAVHRQRFARLRVLHEPGGFSSIVERQVRPSPQQRESLGPILQRYEPRFGAMRQRHEGEMKALIDSLNIELTAVLTPQQMERLRRRGPPPGPGFGNGGRRHDGPPEFPPGPGSDHQDRAPSVPPPPPSAK
jgi:hypothetical protein